MGSCCSSCCGSDDKEASPDNTPDPEIRRRQQLEATEKRLQNQDYRGIKNPARVLRMQKKSEDRDRLQEDAARKYDGSGGNLKWTMN